MTRAEKLAELLQSDGWAELTNVLKHQKEQAILNLQTVLPSDVGLIAKWQGVVAAINQVLNTPKVLIQEEKKNEKNG